MCVSTKSKSSCQNVRKKEVEKLRAKKPPRACCAQVPIWNLRILDTSLLVCAHRNLLSRLLGAGRSCPCLYLRFVEDYQIYIHSARQV